MAFMLSFIMQIELKILHAKQIKLKVSFSLAHNFEEIRSATALLSPS